MPQPSSPAPAPAPSSTQAPAPATGGLTRSDGVVSGNAPAPSVTGTATTGQPGGAAVPAQSSQSSGGGGMMLIMIAPIALLMIMMFFGNRKEQKKRAELMSNLQRNDKVQTIGGVIGRVAEISDNEVILHVDEVTKTRMCVSRQAISAVLNRAGAKAETAKA